MNLFNDEKISHVEKELNPILDIERVFIKAEIYFYDDIILVESELVLREKGKIRSEKIILFKMEI